MRESSLIVDFAKLSRARQRIGFALCLTIDHV
jgi:hypothetical protein